MAKGSQNAEADLTSLYGDLKRLGDAQSFDKALKVADTILKAAPNETEAVHSKVVCLIQLNDFQNAINTLEKYSNHSGHLGFEKAYCYYRLYDNEKALQVLNGIQKLSIQCKELKAQLLYRMEDYEGSMQLFKDVLKNSEDDYDEERQTNYSAVVASLSMTNPDSDLETPDLDDESYERCYNTACFLIGQGDYKSAEQQLKKAEVLCKESLDDEDMTEEEKDDELSIIRVQMAYCTQMLGDTNEALKVYNSVLKNKPTDTSVAAVAGCNIVTINQDQNVFDSKKKMKLATAPDLDKKLPSRHLETIDVNSCLLSYHSNQIDACRGQCKKLREQYPNNDVPLLVEGCLLSKIKQQVKAIQLLRSSVEEMSEPSLTLQLSLAQLYLSQGDTTQACATLRALGPYTYKPAIVSLLISLYMSNEDVSSVSEFLTDVVSWYDKNESDSPVYKDILKATAEFHMKQKNPKSAAEQLEKLRKLVDEDRSVLSMLFAAYSQFDPKKAKQISSELPSVESLAAAIDVASLEESPRIMGNKYKAKGKDDKPADSEGTNEQESKKKSRKKKRKVRLPKDYNPEVDPDPERWLPKQERSTWKGRKRDKKKHEVGKGSQGATAGGGPELDITKMESTAGATDPHPHQNSGTKGYSASKQQQKKKKRGGKK